MIIAEKDAELADLRGLFDIQKEERDFAFSGYKALMLENQRLNVDVIKLLSQVKNQDEFFYNKINMLVKRKIILRSL